MLCVITISPKKVVLNCFLDLKVQKDTYRLFLFINRRFCDYVMLRRRDILERSSSTSVSSASPLHLVLGMSWTGFFSSDIRVIFMSI